MNNTVTQTSDRASKIPVWLIIFLLAALVRGLYLYESSRNPTFYAPIVDSQSYDQLARQLAQGKPIAPEFFWQQCLYSFFLSAVYFFCNSSILCAKIIQALLGCVTCVLTYYLGKKLYGQTAGIIAGCIIALYGPLIFFETELLTEGLAVLWTIILLFILLNAAESRNAVLYLVLGICSALSIATRPNFIPFLLAALIWLIVLWVRQSASIKKLKPAMIGIIAGFLLAALPIAVLNLHTTGSFSILPHTGGVNLYIGNNPDFEAVSIRPGLQWQKIVDTPAKLGLHTWREQQFYFYKKTLEYIYTQPISFLKGLIRKTAEFISSREIPGNVDIYLFTRWSKTLNLLVWKIDGFGFPLGILLPLAISGLFFLRRKTPVPVILFCILYSASIIITHIEARYRMPVIVPVCILAGAALTKISRIITTKQWPNMIMISLFCVGAAFLCSIPGPFYSEKYVNYEAELHYALGGSLSKQGRIEDAIKAYSKVIDLRGDCIEAHHNIGLLLAKQNEPEKAISHYRKALELDPENAALHRDLGLGLFMLGKINDAVEHYHKAIKINPQNAAVYEYLALALQSQGMLDEAVSYYHKALTIEPRNAETQYNLGVTLQLQGKLDQAAEHYIDAIKIQPHLIKARSNLAVILAAKGRLDEAVDNFTEALKAQPDSAEIHNNLAYALESQGKLHQAVEHYRCALRINPDYLPALNNIANILVTYHDTNLGNINEALTFAERAAELTKYGAADTLDILASAYAAANQFDKAVTTAHKALTLATAANNNTLVDQIRTRLELYKQTLARSIEPKKH
jgi:tetratricopeptide (TPR) repeat protein/4-amino-4-deoxy-L-arabinose transferase-like glycosyltransferase